MTTVYNIDPEQVEALCQRLGKSYVDRVHAMVQVIQNKPVVCNHTNLDLLRQCELNMGHTSDHRGRGGQWNAEGHRVPVTIPLKELERAHEARRWTHQESLLLEITQKCPCCHLKD